MTTDEVIFGVSLSLIGCITIICMYFMSNIFEIQKRRLEIEEMKLKKELGIKKDLDCRYMPNMWVTKTETIYGDKNNERQTSTETKKSA